MGQKDKYKITLRRTALAVAVSVAFSAPAPSLANPSGASVSAGGVTFSVSGNLLTITNTPGAVINWQQFSIQKDEITRFIQQNAASSVLNRVVGQNPSLILGQLQSNGRVFLINPSGIAFGKGAIIDVAGFAASTLNINDADFISGRLRFSGTGAEGKLTNAGTIRTPEGGHVYLIAPNVENTGVISSPKGEVVIAAGKTVELVNARTPDLRVEFVAPDNQAVNAGEIIAASGSIGIYGTLVRNSGRVSASRAEVGDGGKIVFRATKDVTLEATSRLDANGAKGGQIKVQGEGGTTLASGTVEAKGEAGKGGEVQILGHLVGLVDNASVDASGELGGGTVLVGGDYQGKNLGVQNAQRTYIAPDAAIRADAGTQGDGGKVIVWADGDTRFHGGISARGGVTAGNGGMVEVSGKQLLDVHGRIDVGAQSGTGGRVLFDPLDITLDASVQPSPPNNANGTPDVAFADPDVPPPPYTIQIADVTGYSELFLQATNNITLAAALTMAAGNSVRFEANNNININANLTTSGAGGIILKADADNLGGGALSLGGALAAGTGGIQLSGASIAGAGTITTTGAANQNAGNVSIVSTGLVNLTGAITASGGTAGAGNPGRNGGTVGISAGTTLSTGAITAAGTNANTAGVGGAGGVVTLSSVDGVTTGNVAISGGNAVGGNNAGGAGGTITVTNTTTGNVTLGTLTARAGSATGTAAAVAGFVNASNTAALGFLQSGAIDTRGNNNGAGGAVTLSSASALQFGAGATIQTGGGTALANTAGRAGGAVNLTAGTTLVTQGLITTSGGAGNGAGQAGGAAGNITASSNGTLNVSAGNLNAVGGNGVTANADGGNAGAITLTNNSTGSGNVSTAGLTATSGNAVGSGAAGAAGSVTVINRNATALATLSTAAISVNGGARGAGGSVLLHSDSDVSVTGTIQATGGGAAAGGTHAGAAGGSVIVEGVNRSLSTTVTANGGAGGGTNQAGGAAGLVRLTGTNGTGATAGTLTTAGVTVSTGAATGLGAGGAAGSIRLEGTAVGAGILTTTGGANGAGGTITATASTGLLNITGAIASSGGAANASSPGSNAGAIVLEGVNVTTLGITANGSAGATALSNQAGGAGGSVQITSTGGVSTVAIAASGGTATTTNAAGGNAGSITIQNSVAGNVTTTTLTAATGNAMGSGAGGAVTGGVLVDNTAGGVQTGAITTTGGTKGNGGGVALSASGLLNVTGAITSSGGTAAANSAGRDAGAVTLSGSSVTTAGITANGSNGNGNDFGGGAGGNVSVTGTGGSLGVGAISTIGGNGVAGNAAGGNAGAITLDAGGGTPTITLAGNLTATGGARTGTGVAGSGAQIRIRKAALLNAATVTFAATGGTGGGASGDVRFEGAVDSTGGARNLVVNTTAATLFDGAVGASAALQSLTTNAGGATTISGGSVTTVAAQTYNDAVTLGANTTLTGTVPTFGPAVTGAGYDLALDFSGTTTITGGTFTGIKNLSSGNGGTTQLTGVLTTSGSQTYDDAVSLIAATTLNAGNQAVAFNGTLNGAQTLIVNTSGTTTFGGAVGATTALTSVTTNAGGTTAINGGSVRTTGAQTYNDAVTLGANASLTSTTNQAIVLNGTLDGAFDLAVNTTGATTFGGAVGATTALASLTTNAGGTTAVNGGSVRTSGAQTYNDAVTLGANTAFSSTGTGSIVFGSTLNSSGLNRTASVDAGGAVTFGGAVGGTLALSTLFAHASSDLTLGGNVTVSGAGDAIVLVADGNFLNTGAGTLAPGAGRWLVYSTSPGADNRGGLVPNFKHYGLTYGGAYGGPGTGNGFVYSTSASVDANLTGTTSKVYDGTTSAVLTPTNYAVTGALAGDTVLLDNPTLGTYADKNVGTGKSVSATVSIASASAGGGTIAVYGYTLNTPTASGNIGDITARALTVTASGQNKVYDSATAATVTLGDNRVAGDVLTSSYTTADFNNKNVGIAKPISVSGIGLSGADSGNYTFNTTASTNADITARALTVTASGQNKVYDGTTAATVTLADNRVVGDALTSSYAAADFNNKNVGTAKPVSVSGIGLAGADAGNYTFNTTASTNADITPRALTVTAAGIDKVYDATVAASVTYGDNRVAGDVLTASGSASFADKNVGTAKPVSVSGIGLSGTDSGNYTFNTTASTSANITARALAVTASGQDKVYDATTAATVALGDNRVAGDVLSTSYAAADFNNKNVGVAKPVSVSGILLSGADAGNYTFNTTAGTTADITALALTVTATGQNKVYDGTTAATVTLGDNRIAGDALTSSYTTADFNNKNVGIAKPISVTGIGLSGTDAGNYTFNATASASADVTARALTVSASGQNKVYDGATTATVTLADNRVVGDVLTSSYTTADFNNKNVGTAKPVSVTGIGLAGADAGNYTFNTTASTNADITARALTVTASGQNKVYDSTTTATVTLADNRVVGDVLTSSYTTADFNNKNVGTAKPVSVSGIGLVGADAGNYTFNTTAATSADITARALTVTASGQNKVYDGATTATVTLADNRVAGDVLTSSYTTADFNNKNVGTAKPVSVNGIGLAGADAGNYTFNTTAATSADITARALTVTASGQNKAYDGATAATVTLADNRVAGDVLTSSYTTADFNNKNVGTAKPVSVTGIGLGGADAGNYTFNTTASTSADITARALTVTASGQNKVYDSTTTATVTLADNRVAGDALTPSYTTADFNNKNVGTAKPVNVSGIGLAGADAGNYTFNTTASTSADITARALTVTASGQDKVYDGATIATVTLGDNRIAGDVLTTSYTTADFNNKNVGIAKPVNVTGIGLAGTDAGNYTFNTTAATSADITARALTVTASGQNKVYDGATTATVSLADNRVAGDVLTPSYAAADFNNKNVGAAKPVSVTGIGLSGADAGNYTFNTTAGTSADITARALTVSASGQDKVYDGTIAATVTLADNRVVGDALTTSYTAADFNNKNVGTAKPVSVSGIGIAGVDAGNYTFNTTAGTSADITARALTVTATGQNKVYDSTTTATVTLADNRVVGDVLTPSYAAADFNNKNVGIAKPVNVTGIALSGADAVNYAFNSTASTTADITARALTIAAQTNSKTYDATTSSAAAPTVSGLQGADTVSGLAQAYADKNAGTNKTLNVSAYTVNDGNSGGNYTVSTVSNATGVINQAALTIAAQASTKTYDATTTSATAPIVTGLQGADSVTGLAQAYADKDAGTGKSLAVGSYTVNDGFGGGNYTVGLIGNTAGVINPAALTVTTIDTSRPIAQPNPPFAASYAGLQGSDTSTSLTGSLVFATLADTASPAGTYAVTPSGVASPNYSIVFVSGTLQVVGTTAVVPDPLASVQSTLNAPLTTSAVAVAPAGRAVYAAGRDDEPGAQFLNGLPPPAAGKAERELAPLEACAVPGPLALLRCGPLR